MDEGQFLRLVKILLSSVLVPSHHSSSSSSSSVASPKTIDELLRCQSFLDFLDSKEDEQEGSESGDHGPPTVSDGMGVPSSAAASGELVVDSIKSIKDTPLGSLWCFWNSSYDRNHTKGLQKDKYSGLCQQDLLLQHLRRFLVVMAQNGIDTSTSTSTSTSSFFLSWPLLSIFILLQLCLNYVEGRGGGFNPTDQTNFKSRLNLTNRYSYILS